MDKLINFINYISDHASSITNIYYKTTGKTKPIQLIQQKFIQL